MDDLSLSSGEDSDEGPRPIKSMRSMKRPTTTGAVTFSRKSTENAAQSDSKNNMSSSSVKIGGGPGGDFINVSGEKENTYNSSASLPRRPHTKGDTRSGSGLKDRFLGVTRHQHFDKNETFAAPEELSFNPANGLMLIEPKRIEFHAIKPSTVYAMTFSVKNCTRIGQRIRIDAPKSPYFALNYIPTTSVAPGLDVIAEVECKIPESSSEMSFSDVVKVSLGQYSINIPLFASKHHAEIKFEHLVDMGYTPIGNVVTKDIYFENTGQISTLLNLHASHNSNFKFSPSSEIALAPGQKKLVVASFESREIGSFRDLVTVTIPGSLKSKDMLDISVQVVNQKLSLISDENGLMSNINFGRLFYGQKKNIKAKLVNTGPSAISFSIYYPDDEKLVVNSKSALNAEGNDAASCGEQRMIFTPAIGVIQPFGEIPVEINFDPILFIPKAGFASLFQNDMNDAKVFSRKAIIESQQLNEKVDVQMVATLMSPNFEISHDFLDFGDCPYNDRRDILISVTNKSPLKTAFEFGRNAQFTFSPSKGRLNSETTISIVATFKPLQLGIFKTTMTLAIADGLRSYDIKVYGESEVRAPNRVFVRGPDKMPEDFAPNYKFVDPIKLAASRREKSMGQMSSLPSGQSMDTRSEDLVPGLTSCERDELYDLRASRIALEEPKIPFDDTHPYKQRLDNEKTYNDFLQTSHKNRLELKTQRARRSIASRGGSLDRNDPWGVDMGMDRGLPEQFIPLPPQDENLWLQNRGAMDGSKPKVNVDENRLITKKFSSVPSTQADIKDCQQELSVEDLTKVVISHKTINFGKVCVNSTVSKNFSFVNDLSHSILVKIFDLEPELKQSKPDTQIVPKDSTAGFDIIFTGRILGKYRKVFSFSINGKNTQKVVVVAEIVPIELELSQSHLKFEFQNSNLDSYVTKDFVLTNPGNAPAHFLWGRSSSFEVKPDRGVVEIGQSALMCATWRPSLGKRNEEQIGLHITGGTDRILVVEGHMPDVQATFEQKKINLGTMAVGLTKEVVVHIKNTGNCPAVLYMNTYEEKYGITCMPDTLCVPPGDVMSVNVKVQPKEAIQYNFNLGATIRGGNVISVKMVGESAVPDISLSETSFEFGLVVTGSEWILPWTLTNNSQIVSCMQLDLSQYPDFKPFLTSGEDKYPQVPIKSSQADEDGNVIESINANGDLISANISANKDKNMANIWKVSIQPGSTMKASIIFIPKSAKNFSFQLPLFIWGMQKLENAKNYNVLVTAEATRSRLDVSTKIIDFGDRVVSRDPMTRNSYSLEFTMKNIDLKQGLNFELREHQCMMTSLVIDRGGEPSKQPVLDEDGLSVFFIAPNRATLSSGASIPVRITFMPKTFGAFEKHVDIFISGQADTSRPYMSVTTRGCGVFPKITFDRQTVAFPVVPLGVTTRAMFTIYNKGYAQQVLKQNSSPIIPVPLEVSCPDGLELNAQIKSLRVIVSWKSNQPVSWSGKLEFSDAEGEKFPILLSGCTDNCILTNYSFLNNYSDIYGLLGLEHQSTKLYKKTLITELVAADVKRKEAARKQKLLERQKRMEGKLQDKDKDGSKKGKKEKKDSKEASLVTGESTASLTLASASVENRPANSFPEEDSNDGVDLERQSKLLEQFYNPSTSPGYIDADIRVLLSWMNRFVCRRPFLVDNFPQCIIDTNGDLVIDYVEQVSGKPMNGVQSDAAALGSAAGSRPSTASTSAFAGAKVSKLVQKYQSILNSLVRSGALVNHINPNTLLGLDDHLVAQEIELRKFIGSRISIELLDQYKDKWITEYTQNCKCAWLDILFQILKVYVLSRVTLKDLSSMPFTIEGIAQAPPTDLTAGGGNETARPKTSKKTPPEYNNSNVYSLPELLLFAWSSAHVAKSINMKVTTDSDESEDTGSSIVANIKRIVDLEIDIRDMYILCQVVHSNLPTLAQGALKEYKSVDRSQKNEVFATLVKALHDVRLDWDVRVEDFMTSRSLIVMLLHLYINLPSLVPKSTIEFKGMLGASLVKVIELRNPSKKRVTYDVSVSGSPDFQPEARSFSIPPEGVYEFKVKFVPRFSESSYAVINFWGVRDSGVAGSNLVFSMKSTITGIQAIEVIEKTCCLYEKISLPMNILCPFNQTFKAQMRIVSEHNSIALENLIKDQFHKKQKNSGYPEVLTADPDEAEIARLHVNPVWCCEMASIILQPGATKNVNFAALAVLPGAFKIQVFFSDVEVGEFCYEIHLNVGLPKVSDTLEFECHIAKDNVAINKALRVGSKNQLFEKAISTLCERVTNAAKKTKARLLLQSLLNVPFENPEIGTSAFCIDLLSPVFKTQRLFPFVSEYTMIAASAGKSQGSKFKKCPKTMLDNPTHAEATGPTPNSALILFSPQRAGTYNCKALIYANDNKNDIRIVELIAIAGIPKSHTAIEFKGPARQKMMQEIPIANTSNEDWDLAVTINGFGFSGPKAIVIPPLSKAVYALEFLGTYVGRFDGILNFKNIVTNDVFDYNLEGIADDPLAEDHIYLKCKARAKEILTVNVFNIPTNKNKVKFPAQSVQRFAIETDIPYMSGSDFVDVPSGETVKYKFSVNPPIGGLISGSINFIDKETGALLWYTVEVEVSSPPPEKSIRVESMVRKAVAVELLLDNPTSNPLVFDVNVEGEGLIGNNTFELHPNGANESAIYELIFSPLVSGEFRGKISFQNDRVGLIWYELVLIATPAPYIEIEPFECIIGGSLAKTIQIENPAGENVTLEALISDPEHFRVVPEVLKLAPFQQASFEVHFSPTSLQNREEAEIKFSHPKFGEIKYYVTGVATSVGDMKVSRVFTQLSDSGSVSIVFRNPFNHPLPIDFQLQEETSLPSLSSSKGSAGNNTSSKSPWTLMNKHNNIVVVPRASANITISFMPHRLCEYNARLIVRSQIGGKQLIWNYPIIGIAEAASMQVLQPMMALCKQSIMREDFIQLHGLVDEDFESSSLTASSFVCETMIDVESQKNLVNRSFRIQLLEVVKDEQGTEVVNGDSKYLDQPTADKPAMYKLKLQLLFEPLKSFKSTVDIVVSLRNKGRWRSTIDVFSNDAEPDDKIDLVAQVGGVDRVSFKLTNRFLGYSTFQAYFSAKSSPFFSVSPSSGVLAPFGSEGTSFVVSYAPTQFGSRDLGNLIIVTEDAQWTYKLTGRYPENIPGSTLLRVRK